MILKHDTTVDVWKRVLSFVSSGWGQCQQLGQGLIHQSIEQNYHRAFQ